MRLLKVDYVYDLISKQLRDGLSYSPITKLRLFHQLLFRHGLSLEMMQARFL